MGRQTVALKRRGTVGWYYGIAYRRVHNAWVNSKLTEAEIKKIFSPTRSVPESELRILVTAETGIQRGECSGDDFIGPSD